MFFNNTNVENTEYYNLLGIDSNASNSEIKKSYKKLAMKHHPDKGGDPEKFKQITEAFQVIGDENKRKLYDSGGNEAVNSGMDPSNMFNMFNSNNNSSKQNKGKSTQYNLNIKLEDIYNGITKSLQIKRLSIDKNSINKCSKCNGNGLILKTVKMGFMTQQMQTTCDKCCGNKFTYHKSINNEKLKICIPKGTLDKKKIIIYEKGDDIPNGIAGDIHVIINEKPHNYFKRKGSDLYYEYNISLVEALCGFELDLVHLDGRKLLIKTNPGDITKPILNNPLKEEVNTIDWNIYENKTINTEPIAKADIINIEYIKRAIEKGELKDKNVTAFRTYRNTTYFYNSSNNDLDKSKVKLNGSILYVRSVNNKNVQMLKCIEGEGLPVYSNPILRGNLFLLFNIQFPDKLSNDLSNYLLNSELALLSTTSKFKNDTDNVEVHYITEKDPIKSYKENCIDDDTSEDEDEQMGMGQGQAQQCAQQ